MTAIRSLGLHKPAALSYLINEGFLPEGCSHDAYIWETFEDNGKVDELISTDTHVVWAGGSNVYRIFSFDVEKEPVKQALFARFSNQNLVHRENAATKLPPSDLKVTKRQTRHQTINEHSTPTNETTNAATTDLERALVVLLQSHAQIFFLSGARSVIPFQFEVERAYPLEQGLILQRKYTSTDHASQPGSLNPKTPSNSFAFGNSFTASPAGQSFTTPQSNRAPTPAPAPAPAFVKSLFDSVLAGQDTQTRANVPFHYHLTDPFDDFGVLSSDVSNRHSEWYREESSLFDRHEQIVYVSSKDEALAQTKVTSKDPLQLAVTVNVGKQTLSIWQITKPISKTFWRPHRRVTSYETDRKRRRRSSQPGTGAVTPNARQSMGTRESFGGPQESFAGRDQLRDDGDLAAQLDPAFQNPRAPGQTSRRISSMLARSDLAGMDMFNDGAGGGPAPAGRRGPSLGGVNRSFRAGVAGKRDIRTSLRSDIEDMDGDMSEDDDHAIDAKSMLVKLMSVSKGMRVDLQLLHLHTTTFDPSLAGSLRVLSISSSREGDKHEELTVCVHSRNSRELYLIEAQAMIKDGSWYVKIGQQRRAEDIIDVCAYRDVSSDKLAILSQAQDNSFEVTLQAPHTTSFKNTVPSQLLFNFPYKLEALISPVARHSIGQKRRVDNASQSLERIATGAGRGQVIITDSTGGRHLFKIAIQPENRFVKRCITLCEIIWRPQRAQRQRFLQGWWEVKQYLQRQNDTHPESEWTALVILLFTLCCPLDNGHTQSPVRQKRKGGGLLRSSSGAVVDLENYYTAIAQECRRSSRPTWGSNTSWQWATDEGTHPSPATGGLGLAVSSLKLDREPLIRKSAFLVECAQLARNFASSETGKQILHSMKIEAEKTPLAGERTKITKVILFGLHFLREELKLNQTDAEDARRLCPILAQLGGWLGWNSWSWRSDSFYMVENIDMANWSFEETIGLLDEPQIADPPSVLRSIAEMSEPGSPQTLFPRLSDFVPVESAAELEFDELLPRIARTRSLLFETQGQPPKILTRLQHVSIDHAFVETLPEGVAASLRAVISSHQSEAHLLFNQRMAELLDRPDLALLEDADARIHGVLRPVQGTHIHSSIRDSHAMCRSIADPDTSHVSKTDAAAEMDRIAVTRLIFKDDHRIAEAQKLLHPLEPPIVRCSREPDMSEHEFLEAEQELAKVVAIRTLSVSAGRGLLQFGARSPLLTERFPTHGFTLSCVMKPSNNSVTAEKETFTEEKVSWAFFHAGAEAGLSISRNSKGIDTSWIVFNKPPELNNRHAGFLLALGLNGHLKNIAKWVAFKYLTPKHTMTSVGLLLGLAASYLGTMDTLITRLLSVHVTRMLPPGAAELNLSSLTQTTGIMALGLLYCDTQHRRMTEVMLSEMENSDQDETECPLETLRDEGYRLAAGFALGFINIGQGKSLKGLHDMHMVERLLGLAVSTKQVHLMHILDKGTAAATVAIALIFMKTEDEALAKKVDIPDTPHQFEYIRPDLFLLRTVARHLIMWNRIQPTTLWLKRQLPPVFQARYSLREILMLDIKDLPLYNTIAGLCLAIGLRYAGSANKEACNVLLRYLDQFMRLTRLPTLSYDHRLTRTTVRNCQDVVALAAATVMAGTGNVDLFRRLRSLHGRTDPDTTYGSHLAAHQAIGVLFLAGGTHTFKTSNLAVASLLCAFYPLFPAAVLDNKGHLQAFRHMWVLATEPRCLVVRDIDSHRPISMPIQVKLKAGTTFAATAPCLLPDLSTIGSVSLSDPKYWNLTLDFGRLAHREAFERHQSMFAAHKRVEDSRAAPFVTAMQAQATVHDEARGHDDREGFDWVFDLPSMNKLSVPDRTSTLPSALLANHAAMNTGSVDDRLILRTALAGASATDLWSLKVLFMWAEQQSTMHNQQTGWLEREVIGGLKAELNLLLS